MRNSKIKKNMKLEGKTLWYLRQVKIIHTSTFVPDNVYVSSFCKSSYFVTRILYNLYDSIALLLLYAIHPFVTEHSTGTFYQKISFSKDVRQIQFFGKSQKKLKLKKKRLCSLLFTVVSESMFKHTFDHTQNVHSYVYFK